MSERGECEHDPHSDAWCMTHDRMVWTCNATLRADYERAWATLRRTLKLPEAPVDGGRDVLEAIDDLYAKLAEVERLLGATIRDKEQWVETADHFCKARTELEAAHDAQAVITRRDGDRIARLTGENDEWRERFGHLGDGTPDGAATVIWNARDAAEAKLAAANEERDGLVVTWRDADAIACDAQRRLRDAEKVIAAQRETLLVLEWGYQMPPCDDHDDGKRCPWCWNGRREGHTADCRIAAALTLTLKYATPKPSRSEHVCGLRGFAEAAFERGDKCPACTFNREAHKTGACRAWGCRCAPTKEASHE